MGYARKDVGKTKKIAKKFVRYLKEDLYGIDKKRSAGQSPAER